MALYMIWYRTKGGKIKTTKVNAKTQTGAVKSAKRKFKFEKPMRVLKLKDQAKKRKTAKKKTTRKRATRKKTTRKKATRKKATRKKSTKKKVTKRKVTRKKTVKRKSSKEKGGRKMAKRKRKSRKKRGGGSGGRKGGQIQKMLMAGAMGAAGGIAGGAVANMIPLPANMEKMKPFIPLVMGLAMPMVPFGSKEMRTAMGIGLITLGAASLIRQFAPTIPMLAGEGDEDTLDYNEMDLLGYDDDISESEQDVAAMVEGDSDEIMGDSMDLEGDFISPADM